MTTTEIIDLLDQKMRNSVRTDEEADEYMSIVYFLYVAYQIIQRTNLTALWLHGKLNA